MVAGKNVRNIKLDILKTIAIFSVIFYHLGLLKYGYLGVDIFLVINGFLIGRSIANEQAKGNYNYFKFILKKIIQFWPLILLAGIISLVVGYYCMLPDDYENLSESVVATNFFVNNILSAITTKNYWDVTNEFKPFMHTWYMGVLIQSYLIIGLVPVISKFLNSKKIKKISLMLYLFIFCVSLLLYLLPFYSNYVKFYFFPFRLFELLIGLLLYYNLDYLIAILKKINFKFVIEIILFILLLLSLITTFSKFSSVRLLWVCIITALLILFSCDKDFNKNVFTSVISYFGKISYSLFIWHQILLAFVRYSLKTEFVFIDYLFLFILMVFLAIISYRLIETYVKKINEKILIILLVSICAVSTLVSLLIYNNAGVVRDVPELDISRNNVHRNMHAEYNDRGYNYTKDFDNDIRTNVLVIGNSFGRDWVNILLESKMSNQINISYLYQGSNSDELSDDIRFEKANYIFYTISSNKYDELPEILNSYYELGKLYIVGNKNFGSSNGIIYFNRNKANYFNQTILLSDDYYTKNKKLSDKYGPFYVDMIKYVSNEDGRIRVFTDNNKFISQDTRHLTRAGAYYYSTLINWDSIFK